MNTNIIYPDDISDFERDILIERQREGIRKAKERGVYKGGKRLLTKEQEKELQELVEKGWKKQISPSISISNEPPFTIISINKFNSFTSIT